MPDVKDAIELIADPANVHVTDDHSGERKIKWNQIVKLLKKSGAKPADARQLVADAVQELGGRVESGVELGGGRGGAMPDRKKTQFVGFVPPTKSAGTSAPVRARIIRRPRPPRRIPAAPRRLCA